MYLTIFIFMRIHNLMVEEFRMLSLENPNDAGALTVDQLHPPDPIDQPPEQTLPLALTLAFPETETIPHPTENIIVSDVTNDFYLVRFSDPDDYKRAAFGGPWKIFDYYISVARWTPGFNEEEPIKTILTWVRLPRLLIHYFSSLAVTRIGNCIWKTVRLDLATEAGVRARYA
ncbi:hypothetical protein LINPERHAP2_LOCUS41950 [Linum perenne]